MAQPSPRSGSVPAVALVAPPTSGHTTPQPPTILTAASPRQHTPRQTFAAVAGHTGNCTPRSGYPVGQSASVSIDKLECSVSGTSTASMQQAFSVPADTSRPCTPRTSSNPAPAAALLSAENLGTATPRQAERRSSTPGPSPVVVDRMASTPRRLISASAVVAPAVESTGQSTPRQPIAAASGSDPALLKRMEALEQLLSSEIKGLRKMCERLERQQEDCVRSNLSFHTRTEQMFGALQVDIVDIQQKLHAEQEKSLNTEALDYAEAEVQDLRSSLERLQESQEADTEALKRQQLSLYEQQKQLQATIDKQYVESKTVHQRCLKQCEQDGQQFELLRRQLETLEANTVGDLETKMVMERARVARQEHENIQSFQALNSRLDTLEKQQNTLAKLDGPSRSGRGTPRQCDPAAHLLHDLQAVAARQLAEENEYNPPFSLIKQRDPLAMSTQQMLTQQLDSLKSVETVLP